MASLALPGRLALLATLACFSPAQAQFGIPVPLNAGAAIDGGADVQVDHLVAPDGVLHAIWASQNDYTGSSGGDPDIFYARNDGKGWSLPMLVNSYGTADNGTVNDDREPRLALDGAGVLHGVWQSTYPVAGTGSDWDVFHAVFDGQGWGTATPLPGSTGAPADDLHPTLVGLPAGGVLVAWETDSGAGDRDVVWSVAGSAFATAPAELARGVVPESGDDLGPVALAVDPDGTVIAVWSTDDPQLSLGGDRDIVFAEFPRGGTWSFMTEISELARLDLGDDRDPAVVVIGRGARREVHVVWTSNEPIGGAGGDRDLLHAVQRFPAVYPPQNPTHVVNSNAASDSADDRAPSLCAERGGTLHVAWQTADAFVGDQDVLHAVNATPEDGWSPFDVLGLNGLLDQPGDDDTRPDIECAAAGFISAVWESTDDVGGLVGSDSDLFHALAADRGIDRPEPVGTVAGFDLGDDLDAAIAVDRSGRPHVVWSSDDTQIDGGTGGDRDIFYSVRDVDGWTPPELANINGRGAESGNDLQPSIVVDGEGGVHVAWASDEPFAGAETDYDIFYAYRGAGGWTTPQLVHASGRSDAADAGPNDYGPQLLLSPDGVIQVVWGSNSRPTSFHTDLSWAELTAFGWGPEEVISGTLQGMGFTPYFCAGFSTDPALEVVFASNADVGGTGPDLDLFLVTRDDGLWGQPIPLFDAFSDGSAQDGACSLAYDRSGDLWLVWSTDRDTDGAGPDPDLFVARRSGGSWFDFGPLFGMAVLDSGADDEPRVAALGDRLAVVWESTENIGATAGSDVDLLFATLDPEDGTPSDAVIRLANASGHGDGTAQDTLGGIAVTPAGRLHVVWSTPDTLGGTVANDLDVLHARGTVVHVPLVFADGFEEPEA